MSSACSHSTSCTLCAGTCGKCYTFSTLRKTDGMRCTKCFDRYHNSRGGLYKPKEIEDSKETVNKFLSHVILERKGASFVEEFSDSESDDSEDDFVVSDYEEVIDTTSNDDEESEFSGFEDDFEDGESEDEKEEN